MSRQHNCGECKHLTRTSPTQVFLLCTYWSNPSHGGEDYAWTCGHCHMQVEAPACHMFEARKETA